MTVDGPTPETGGGEGGPEASGEGGADGGDAPTGGAVIYVSPTGNDTGMGLDPAHPKLTVTSALAEAKADPLPRPEVHVCKGTYAEDSILVDFDVKLYGAYDCATWQRTSTYGYPHPDGVDATILASPDTTAQEGSLVVSSAVSSFTVVDGFSIVGPPTTTGHTGGVHVTDTASPTLSNDVIEGGAGQVAASTAATGSVGIVVDMQAAPQIEGCIVTGGSGHGTVGSTGIVLDSTGGVSLHDSIVTGGTGLTTVASGTSTIGVDVRTSLTTPLSALIVDGTDVTGASGQSVGLRIAGTGVAGSVAGCYIEGGLGLDTTQSSIAVVVDTPGGGISLNGDHLYGGERTLGLQQTIGVLVVAAGSFTMEDTLVHGGTVQNATGAFTVGVDLSAVAAPVVAFDTVYTGTGPGTAVALNAGVTGTVLRDDLLLGGDNAASYGVAAVQCSGLIGSLDHTALGNLAALYTCSNSGGTATNASNLTELALALGSAESKNVDIQATCITGDASCATFMGCPGVSSCLPGIFGMTWSSDDGVSALFGSTSADAGASVQGWTLVPGAACSIATGGTTYGGVTTDVYGNKRNAATPTMGAVEYGPTPKCTPN
jgi:hypothetical protein